MARAESLMRGLPSGSALDDAVAHFVHAVEVERAHDARAQVERPARGERPRSATRATARLPLRTKSMSVPKGKVLCATIIEYGPMRSPLAPRPVKLRP